MNSKPTQRILLAVVGSTPQIISETLYYYIKKAPAPQMFSQIVVITTEHGRKKCLEMFDENWLLTRMYSDLGIAWPQPEVRIEVIADARGKSIADIRTPAHNELAAERIFAVTRALCRPAENRVFASLAGGRKTMSSLLMLAMSLYAKRDDILSHVLVQPEKYENNPAFFYPTEKTGDAVIEVSEVPFFRLADNILPSLFGLRVPTFNEIVSLTRQPLSALHKQIRARLDTLYRRLTVEFGENRYEVVFSPKELAIYQYFFESPDPLGCNATRLQQLYRKTAGSDKTGNFTIDQFQRDISQINKRQLEVRLPAFLAPYCRISAADTNVGGTYKIDLPMANRQNL
jgi:CRISPR-associated protein (TIGR02584 family)